MKTLGIILAAGDGTRLNSKDINKTALNFSGKPMISFGVETMTKVCKKTIVVVGAYANTVKTALKDYQVDYAVQKERKGTGHAAKVAMQGVAQQYDNVLLGYGDHMMFYTEKVMQDLIAYHKKQSVAVTLLTTQHPDADKLAWGRIVRNVQGEVIKIVEQKDATEEERKITEINPAFYCFNFKFLEKYLPTIEPSKVTGEYYLTDMVEIAFKHHLGVAGLKVPFENVGIGVNTPEQLKQSQKLFAKYK